MTPPPPARNWSFGPPERRRSFDFRGTGTRGPRLMGIVNVTPDSFSDGGRFDSVDAAVEHGLRLAADGADLLDVGGESTRPGADPVPAGAERDRVVPVVERLAARLAASGFAGVPISIDTMKASVAAAALDAGAEVVNDVSGLTFDPDMIPLCADRSAGVVCMHMRGTPRTMQDEPVYGDVLAEVRDYLADRLRALGDAGIPPERVVLDPGIGFGKTAAHNLALLAGVPALRSPGRPVLIGHSRKRFLKRLVGREVEERLAGTIGVSIALATLGTDLLRVHDVRGVRDALTAWRTVLG